MVSGKAKIPLFSSKTDKAMGLFEYMELLFCHHYKICPCNPRFHPDPSPMQIWPHAIHWVSQLSPVFLPKPRSRRQLLDPRIQEAITGKNPFQLVIWKSTQRTGFSSLDASFVLQASSNLCFQSFRSIISHFSRCQHHHLCSLTLIVPVPGRTEDDFRGAEIAFCPGF